MSEEQQWRVCFYHQVNIVPISPRKQSRPYLVSPTDKATSSSENRLEATHCPSMEASTSVDRSWTLQPVNIPIPPVGGSIDRMVAMHNVVIPTPPGSVTAPSMDRIEVMCSATIPTLPASAPKPCMDQMSDRMAAMRSAAIPIPPVASAASPPQPPLLNNLERMKIVVIPIPPSAATVLSARIEMTDEQLQPPALTGGNVDHPHQSTSIEVVDGQTQPSTITEGDISQGEEPDHGPTVDFGNQDHRQLRALFLNVVAGDAPTPDEHQALEQAGLAMSDADDDFLHMLQTFKSWHGADFPPTHVPYNKQLNRHIVQVMRQLAADIQHLISSRVQNVQAGQYTVDMINLLEVSCHPHVGYSLQPYTRGWYANLCLDMVMISGAEGAGTPHPGNHIVGKLQSHFASMLSCIVTVPRGPDGSLQYMADFKQMRGARIFPITHEYFQWLSMGDRIDEWMEEKVSAYMITVRGVVHELEKNEWDINHLFSWWFALSRLLGLQDA
ncbi:hypothetical protein F5141DRAFT_1065491 [Pisolithus sp. B1]|nr:hypothetical protein F5141DRAFT_1065491 [Pisolithus sp. B1]